MKIRLRCLVGLILVFLCAAVTVGSRQLHGQAVVATVPVEGKVTRGWLGVVIQDITPDLAKSFNVTVTEGVLVSEIQKNSPAKEAGFERGDIVVEYDGKAIRDVNHLRNIVSQAEIGKEVTVKVLREGKEKGLIVKIGEQPADLFAAGTGAVPSGKDFGMTIQNLTKELAKRLGIEEDSGVIVSEVPPGSPAAMSEIREGDLIKEVNRKKISNVAEFKKALSEGDKEKGIPMLVKRGKFSRYAILKSQEDVEYNAKLKEKKRLEQEEKKRLEQEEKARYQAELAEKKRLAQEEKERQQAKLAEKKRLEEEKKRQEMEVRERQEEERKRQEMIARKASEERERAEVRKRRDEFVKKNGVEEWPDISKLFANPFVYEGKTIAIQTHFLTMQTATQGNFFVDVGKGAFFVVSDIPKGMFKEAGSIVVLAGRVLGKTELQLPLLGLTQVPHLKFVGVHFCQDNNCNDIIQ